MSRAIVREPVTAIDHTGHGVRLAAGEYEVVDIDGAAERGEMYVKDRTGDLICVNPRDPAITVGGAS
jgi:hypothetical protein